MDVFGIGGLLRSSDANLESKLAVGLPPGAAVGASQSSGSAGPGMEPAQTVNAGPGGAVGVNGGAGTTSYTSTTVTNVNGSPQTTLYFYVSATTNNGKPSTTLIQVTTIPSSLIATTSASSTPVSSSQISANLTATSSSLAPAGQSSGGFQPTTTPEDNTTLTTIPPFTNNPTHTYVPPPIRTSSTSSSTNATAASANPQPSKPHSLSGGAIGGIVVGVILGLALVGGLVFFFFFRRRRRTGGYGANATSAEKSYDHLESVQVLGTGNPKTWEEHLPAPTDDATLQRELGTLFDQVELHVENFFSPLNLTSDEKNAYQEPVAAAHFQSLSNLRPNLIFRTSSQLAVIKCHLATIIVAALGYSSDNFYSLLPPEFSSFPATMSSANSSQRTGRAAERARAQWRVLSTYLRSDMEQDSNYVNGRDRKIRAIIDDFDNAFRPWFNHRYSSDEKSQNLAGILIKASKVGMTLFSQPTTFAFDWSLKYEDGTRSKTIVITPEVSRTTDERSQPLSDPRVLVEARKVNL